MDEPWSAGSLPRRVIRPAYLTLGGGAGGRSLGSIYNFFRSPACAHSVGAVGGLASSAGIVSREWSAIQSTASSLETNFPKWCTAPFGHTICTRQMLPSRTGNKTVAINQSMLPWTRLTSLLVRRGRNRHQRIMLWAQRPHCCRLGKPSR